MWHLKSIRRTHLDRLEALGELAHHFGRLVADGVDALALQRRRRRRRRLGRRRGRRRRRRGGARQRRVQLLLARQLAGHDGAFDSLIALVWKKKNDSTKEIDVISAAKLELGRRRYRVFLLCFVSFFYRCWFFWFVGRLVSLATRTGVKRTEKLPTFSSAGHCRRVSVRNAPTRN